MPTRRPVNGPGPRPTTTSVRSAGAAPASVEDPGDARREVLRVAAGVEGRSPRRASVTPSWTATVIAVVDVSMASSSTRAGYPAFRTPVVAGSGRRGAAETGSCRRSGSGEVGQPAVTEPGQAQRPGLVGAGRQLDLEVGVGQPLGDAVPPLHDGDAVGDVGVEVEVVELESAAEPVCVDVHQRRAAHESTGGPAR